MAPPHGPAAEFQTMLRLTPDPGYDDDQSLEKIAELAVEALLAEASGMALGAVASVDLDQRVVALEMTIEAHTDSELHQKMGLILEALERGAPLSLRESTAARSPVPDTDLVCA